MIARIWYQDVGHGGIAYRSHDVPVTDRAAALAMLNKWVLGGWINDATWIAPAAIMRMDLTEDPEPEEK